MVPDLYKKIRGENLIGEAFETSEIEWMYYILASVSLCIEFTVAGVEAIHFGVMVLKIIGIRVGLSGICLLLP